MFFRPAERTMARALTRLDPNLTVVPPATAVRQETGKTMVSLRIVRSALLPPIVLALAAGCGVEKSENPLSPSVAGPIAGVEITAPRPVEPSNGTKLKHSQQPVKLMVENANSNGVRPLSYSFEVASDSAFRRKYSRAAA